MAGDLVARGLGGFAAREEMVQQPGQNARCSPKGGPIRGDDEVLIRLGPGDVAQRIDLKGADQAGVEALEVEDQNLFVEARLGLQHVAPRTGAVLAAAPTLGAAMRLL